MPLNSDEFRKILNLLESSEMPSENLEEGPRFNKLVAKLGNNKAKGKVDRDNLMSPMYAGYRNFLGRTGRKGTAADIGAYFSKIGFTSQQSNEILGDLAPAASNNQNTAQQSTQSSSPVSSTPPSSAALNTNAPPPKEPTPTMGTPTSTPKSSEPAPVNGGSNIESKLSKEQHIAGAHKQLGGMYQKKQNHEQLKKNYADNEGNPAAQASIKSAMDTNRKAHADHAAKFNWHNNHSGNTLKPGRQSPHITDSRNLIGNKLMEFDVSDSPLGRGQTKALFTKAAEYAYDNELVKNKITQFVGNNTSSSNGSQFGGYSNTSNNGNNTPSNNSPTNNASSSNSFSNTSPTQQSNNRNSSFANNDAVSNMDAQIAQICYSNGLNEKTLAQTHSQIKKISKMKEITDPEMLKTLSVIGFAFLQSK